MSEFAIRIAKADDAATIKAMIKRARLDPTSVHWENFLVAEYEGQIVSMGQVKPYWGCNELGSLVTLREYRGKGIAAQIISELEVKVGLPLYLLCLPKMEAYYQRFGYETITWWEAPAFLKLKLMLPLVFRIKVLIMEKQKETSA